jgi:nitroreductase
MLRFQSGNTGFTDSIPTLAVITTDTRYFSGIGERNQAWIEGGLFAMSFVWALHALGYDTCMLNMSVPNKTAAALRAEASIDDAEQVIMMIAIGRGRPGHRRARSPRKSVSEVTSR